MIRYDVVIVGGGLVGAGLAAALRQCDLSIALIDARLPDNNDPRLFALNASSCQFLENIGIWSALADQAAPIHQVHVSQQKQFGVVRMDREDVSASSLGHVIPAHFIEKALNDVLLSQTNLTLYRPARLTKLVQENGEVVLTLDGAVIKAGLVIGADGAESSVRQQANIAVEQIEYDQSAIVTRTTLQRPHHQIAYERFTKNGAIAMLPMIGNECATIWTADNASIAALMALSDEQFLITLQAEFGYRLGRLQSIKKRHMFPLRMVRAEKALEQNVLLLGNAAHTLHPIAAQGFNLALYEVAVVAEAIQNQTNLSDAVLRVQKQQTASMSVSHYLPRLFASNTKWMSVLSQLGMVGFDIATPLKKKFMNSMLGRTGNVPSLFLGINE